MNARSKLDAVELRAAPGPRHDEILSPDALGFLAELHRSFNGRRLAALARRVERQKRFDAGETPDFLAETRAVREGDWKVAAIPADLLDRRVEITGPVDRKMIVNALNSGAKVFMADFEDAIVAGVRQHGRGPGQPQGSLGRRHRLHRRDDRQAIRAEREHRRADGAAARLASRRAPSHRRRRGNLGLAVRLRPLRLPLRQGAERAGSTPLSTCRRWRAISRRGSGTTCSLSPKERLGFPTGRSRRPC